MPGIRIWGHDRVIWRKTMICKLSDLAHRIRVNATATRRVRNPKNFSCTSRVPESWLLTLVLCALCFVFCTLCFVLCVLYLASGFNRTDAKVKTHVIHLQRTKNKAPKTNPIPKQHPMSKLRRNRTPTPQNRAFLSEVPNFRSSVVAVFRKFENPGSIDENSARPARR